MSVNSAGILLYRLRDNEIEVLLAHPGGPFWSGKDLGAWTIPKGLSEENEDPLQAAKREFREETGFEVDGQFIDLGHDEGLQVAIAGSIAFGHLELLLRLQPDIIGVRGIVCGGDRTSAVQEELVEKLKQALI